MSNRLVVIFGAASFFRHLIYYSFTHSKFCIYWMISAIYKLQFLYLFFFILSLVSCFIHSIHIAHLFERRPISSFFVCCAIAAAMCPELLLCRAHCVSFHFHVFSISFMENFLCSKTLSHHALTRIRHIEFQRMRDGIEKKKWMSYFPFLLALSSNRVRAASYNKQTIDAPMCIMWPKTIDSFASLGYLLLPNAYYTPKCRQHSNGECQRGVATIVCVFF